MSGATDFMSVAPLSFLLMGRESVELDEVTVIQKFTRGVGGREALGRMTIFFANSQDFRQWDFSNDQSN